ncbi:uncharacterized protein DDB_G0283357, partial [Eurytemora carolleeae]|uniref:uncharacterized protein DDB_G0283357 n=1 Tax=Eurytemora carolleeae TaxID=1294199 RepID=UPI000C784787
MRVFSVFCVLVVFLAGVQAQGGVFSGFMSFVNRFNPFRPTSSSSRPQSFSRPSANTFSRPPSNSFQAPSSNSFPAPSSNSFPASSSNSFASPSSSNSFPSPSSNSFPSSSSNSFPSPSAPSFSSAGSSSSSSSSSGNSNQIISQPTPQQSSSGRGNHQWQGRDYLLSWREGQNGFSWGQAQSYCSQRGMRMISLDSSAKVDHFFSQMVGDRSPYFWAGGRISSDKRTLSWENGRSEGIRKGQHPWSFTGSRGAQPDGQGSEDCLAVLNNFYNDASKFHDVTCS